MANWTHAQLRTMDALRLELDALDKRHLATIARLRADVARLTQERDEARARAESERIRREQAEQEAEKWRGAASVLCGAHVGVSQARCPVCRAEQAEAALTAAQAREARAREACGRLQARADQLFSAASLAKRALDNHDLWCGHRKGSPGDSSYRRAEDALDVALLPSRCLDCGTNDYSGGRAHYEDGMRCMACAMGATLEPEQEAR